MILVVATENKNESILPWVSSVGDDYLEGKVGSSLWNICHHTHFHLLDSPLFLAKENNISLQVLYSIHFWKKQGTL